jgi:hypothetical protein
MNPAYRYGEKLAAAWGALRTGLTHGAVGALPGAAIGGLIGGANGVTRADGTVDHLGGAMRGAAVGGLATGAATGLASGRVQSAFNATASNAGNSAKVIAGASSPMLMSSMLSNHSAPGATTWLNSAGKAHKDLRGSGLL